MSALLEHSMPITHDMIERLSRYRAVLRRLKALGLVRIFSDNLGDGAGVSSSQVRKDFQLFGIHGVRRGGYRIDELAARFDELLGTDGPMQVVVVGCGHIGSALMRTYGIAREGVSVVAGFDVDAAVINPEASPPIFDGREMPAYIGQHGIRVVILAVPEQAVSGVIAQLRGTGVRGILNFAPVPLRDSDTWLVHNIDIRMEIEKLFHHISFSGFRTAETGDTPQAEPAL